MDKEHSNESFEQNLDRFLRSKMNPEEECSFLDFLKANPDYKQRACITALMIGKIIDIGRERDKRVYDIIKN